MANTHEHLEHAEHGGHHGQDPFTQRVAMSMAIVAACLAGISMVGHRTHNKVLQLGGEANRLLGDVNRVLGESNRVLGEGNRVLGDGNRVIGEANRVSTEAAAAEIEKSNLFAWYQAKRQRQAVYQTSIAMTDVLAVKDEARAKAAMADWKKKADEYNDPNDPDSLPNIQKRGAAAGKKAEELRAEAVRIRKEADTFQQQAAELRKEADGFRKQAAEFRKEAAEKIQEADHTHHQADRLDIAHLAAELGLVLCSIAVLTRRKEFWYAGLLAAVIGLALTASAYMIPHDDHPTSSEQAH